MGDVVAEVANELLFDGIASFYLCRNPNLGPANRFWIRQSGSEEDNYIISDLDLEVDTHLPKALLEEPAFDLVGGITNI